MRSPSRCGARTCSHDRLARPRRGRAHARRPRRRRPALRARDRRRSPRPSSRRAMRCAGWCWSAWAAQQAEDALYERVGGALTARLLTSGETRLVVDLGGLELGARDAARLAFGAAARSWRHDLYRTKLGRKQKPTLERADHGRRAARAPRRNGRTRRPCSRASTSPATLVTEPANIVYPETFVARVPRGDGRARRRIRGARREGDGEARHGRPARRRPGLGPAAAAAGRCAGTAARPAPSRSSSSARASPSTPAASRSSRRSAWKR